MHSVAEPAEQSYYFIVSEMGFSSVVQSVEENKKGALQSQNRTILAPRQSWFSVNGRLQISKNY